MNSNSTMIINSKLILILFLLTIFFSYVSPFEYPVGGTKGWGVPPKNDTAFFNHWASHNRFLVGDSVRFVYEKDSVMEVTKDEYKDCRSNRPVFFSNMGNTVYELNHSGFFYFISGVSGHCFKGQKLVLKVLEPEHNITSGKSGDDVGHKKSAASAISLPKLTFLIIQLCVLCFGCFFH